MRRLTCLAALLLAAFPTPALGHGPGAPGTHGPDPQSIDRGADGSDGPRARAAGRSAKGSSRLPARWCGSAQRSDGKENELANGTHRFHAVYAHPRDAAARLSEFGDEIQTAVIGASRLIEATRGRAIRFDMGTGCGAQYLDISTLALPQSSAELDRLAGTGDGTLNAVARALDAAGFPVIDGSESRAAAAALTRNWLVWLDGPAPPGACGQAMLYDDPRREAGNPNNHGGKVAVVFRDGPDRFCGENTVRHEVAHNLGAVLSAAPNASGGHCTDAIEDTMCVPGSRRVADGAYHARYFDYGSDDYWDPPGGALPWWTVNLSRFLCARADCNVPPGFSASASAGRGGPDLGVSARARRYGRDRWRVRISVRGSSAALVSVRCRRPGRRSSEVVWRREADAPDRLGLRVRCASYPRAKVSEPTGAYAITRARRYGRNRWRVDVRVRGDGRAAVALRCRRSRGGRVRVIWSRGSVQTPHRKLMRARCASRPRASARPR